ncbi:18653_t:CDS:2 [Dentiscutata erythropus]|uniref:18653_t:CDS:1 n=1 Tax=Dentiscutata erythropus TaxID=1348616 RepID=A0A9N9AAY3_9GLOM|nr:18653_t:CDS:2 [Dentiscutata erythropus]
MDENCVIESLPVSNLNNTNILKGVADDDDQDNNEAPNGAQGW